MSSDGFVLRKCALAGVEAIEAASAHVFARHTHDAFAIGRITSGGQRWRSGRGLVEARAGDMISSNAGEVHDGAPLGASRSWKMLYVAPPLLGAIMLDATEGRSPGFEFTNPVFLGSPSLAAFESCYAAMTAQSPAAAPAEEALILLFAGLIGGARPKAGTASAALLRAKARIDDDPAAPLGLDALARATGLSRYQALRGFARLTGLPPHAYQVQRRLEAAKKMVASGSSLGETAIACGFSDQSHLHRLFVRRFGLTPGAYRAARR